MTIKAIAESPDHARNPVVEPREAVPTALTRRKRFLAALNCRPVDYPPIWLMRQAGRALPEYRALKQTYSFLQLMQTPELAAEVTLQPIRRFDFDAAILFSDILVVAEAMGQGYHFREQGGIEMDFALRSRADIERLDPGAVTERLQYVANALPLIRSALGGRTALLGFAGSPWTLANFMMEGGSSKDYTRALELFYTDAPLFAQLMEKLAAAVTDFLHLQIDAGADAVQIFDSLGGLLGPEDYDEASGRWIRRIVSGLNGRVPAIVFAKGVHRNWETLQQTGAAAISVDWKKPLATVAEILPETIAVQGNLDPGLMTSTPEIVERETRRLLESMRGRPGHIFNLGHGLPPASKLECIENLVATVRNFR